MDKESHTEVGQTSCLKQKKQREVVKLTHIEDMKVETNLERVLRNENHRKGKGGLT